ncbi:LysR family transcriptional regulator [uncultured Roseobacter sp.]|uniref:LysR family transcriptional regulator n=1 Tax=uncultured Roseobacter sp. TaxID=114847 RepID=UPI0026385329|nr:LysR family transcriptional regulator [uncultured Roseobacter sp.]
MEFNYHHLRYFQAVAEEGNLTRAAALLNVSQSAVSMQIRQLEERLGQPLFERRGRALLLTEAGRIALDHANTIFATGREMVATLQQTGASRQVLRVGAISTLSRNFQLAFLKPVLGRPDVEIVLRSGSMAELGTALAALHLDLVLTNQAPPTDALTPFNVQQLDTQNISLVGPPDRTLAQVPLAEILIRRPLILPTRASGVRAGFDALTERLGLRPQIAAEVDDMAMMRLLVRDGAGLAVLPPIVVRDEIAAGTLTELAVLPELTETFYGVTVGRRFPNPLLVELLQVR